MAHLGCFSLMPLWLQLMSVMLSIHPIYKLLIVLRFCFPYFLHLQVFIFVSTQRFYLFIIIGFSSSSFSYAKNIISTPIYIHVKRNWQTRDMSCERQMSLLGLVNWIHKTELSIVWYIFFLATYSSVHIFLLANPNQPVAWSEFGILLDLGHWCWSRNIATIFN